jgi:hypothetical protein
MFGWTKSHAFTRNASQLPHLGTTELCGADSYSALIE